MGPTRCIASVITGQTVADLLERLNTTIVKRVVGIDHATSGPVSTRNSVSLWPVATHAVAAA
jgi:hypothetical protein